METPSALFDERAADEAVMRSLYNEISRLREELQMSQVIKSTDGKYYVGEFEEVTPDQVTEMIAHKQHQLAELEAIAPAAAQANGGTDNGQAAAADSSQPSADNPAAPSGDGSAPVAPAADQNASAPSADPATPAAPADQAAPPVNNEQQAAPAAPADPNAAAPAQPQAPNLQ